MPMFIRGTRMYHVFQRKGTFVVNLIVAANNLAHATWIGIPL